MSALTEKAITLGQEGAEHEFTQLPQDFTVERLKPSDVESTASLHTKVWLEVFTNEPYSLDFGLAKKRIQEKYSREEIARFNRRLLKMRKAGKL